MRKKDRTGNLYGKNVFVTGASSGIGQACAIAFAKNGCTVTGVSRNTEEKTELFPGGGSLSLHRLDVTDEAAVRGFVERLPGVDIAVLCAGMGVAGPAETTPSEMTRRQMEVNYFGTINAAQPCLTRMRGQGKGLLIVIGSIAGRVSIPMQSQYSASKYALEAFTDAVRMEMKKYGVRACIIEPGDTKTGFTAARVTQDDSGAEGYGDLWYGSGHEIINLLTGTNAITDLQFIKSKEIGVTSAAQSSQTYSEDDKTKIFMELCSAKQLGRIYFGGTYNNTGAGLNEGHAYSVLGGRSINGERYVLLRNPYANMSLKYNERGDRSKSTSFFSSTADTTCGQFLMKLDDFH